MHIKLAILILSSSVILSACQSNRATKMLSPEAGIEHFENKVSTRIYASKQCLLTHGITEKLDESRGVGTLIASIFIPIIVEYAITEIVKELKDIDKVDNTGSTVLDLYTANFHGGEEIYPTPSEDFTCFTVVTGKFAVDSAEMRQSPQGYISSIDRALPKIDDRDAAKNALTTAKGLVAALKVNNIHFVSEEHLNAVYEFRLEQESDKTAMYVENHLLFLNKLLNNEKSREIAYTIRLFGPGTSEKGPEYLAVTQSFGTLKSGTAMIKGGINKKDSNTNDFKTSRKSIYAVPLLTRASWIAFLRDHHKRKEIKEKADSLCADLQKVDSKANCDFFYLKTYMPTKLEATFTQLKKPTDTEKFLAAILEKAKEPISSALVSEFATDNTLAIHDAKIAIYDACKAKKSIASDASEELKETTIALNDEKIKKANYSLRLLGEATISSC